MKTAQYYDTPQLRELHSEVKKIMQLEPTTSITLDNVDEVEDETLPSQKSGLHTVFSQNKRKAKHSNCTTEYWLKNGGSRKVMIQKCVEYGIGT